MGFDPDREQPCYFTKASRSLAASGSKVPYPPATRDLHHEIELVVAIGNAGFELAENERARRGAVGEWPD